MSSSLGCEPLHLLHGDTVCMRHSQSPAPNVCTQVPLQHLSPHTFLVVALLPPQSYNVTQWSLYYIWSSMLDIIHSGSLSPHTFLVVALLPKLQSDSMIILLHPILPARYNPSRIIVISAESTLVTWGTNHVASTMKFPLPSRAIEPVVPESFNSESSINIDFDYIPSRRLPHMSMASCRMIFHITLSIICC